ncbi:protein kinase [Streptomyces sp. H27-H1]|uniref:serine/threonine-protein kinase n=1 Tax=Streptomyces sp. H27-H1 TaxID=2996461 RepID=UPI00226EF5C5|nr:serine/threonine-protein kinase [Streptomyces sp. H27-H1]MCY0928014.1 protein kinase [Streptomyces sp. H27-H1]
MSTRPVPTYGAPSEDNALIAGRYRLRSAIGSGGTADVFRAIDEMLGREVAVKVFRPGTDTVTADTFCEEARTLAQLSHAALVTVYDAGRHAQGAFMVTELIRGMTLRTRIDAGPLGPVQVVRLGVEIASALDHVHARGIVHHDVKPSNILLSEGGSPHLADFGLSRRAHGRPDLEPEMLVGTPAYMAPEQLLGEGASTAGDIYALGLTLLEALTGRREYQGTPLEAGTARLLHPPSIPLGLPGDLGRLLGAMTDPEPRARPDAARVHLHLRDITRTWATTPTGPAGPLPAVVNVADTEPATHRSVPAPLKAARHAAPPWPMPATLGRQAANRHRAAAWGLAATALAGICTLLVGGVPEGVKASPATTHEQTSPPNRAEAPAPQPTLPSPSEFPLPELAVAAASTTPHLPVPVTPTRPQVRQPADSQRVKNPPPAKSKDNPGKGKDTSKDGKGKGSPR